MEDNKETFLGIEIKEWAFMFTVMLFLFVFFIGLYATKFNEEYEDLSHRYINKIYENQRNEQRIRELESQLESISMENMSMWESLGMFEVTAYGSDCKGCTGITYTGTVPQIGKTISVDPQVIPFGSVVMIDGKEFVAEDKGSAIKGNRIDMFVGTEAESTNYGVQQHEVYIKTK